MSRSVAFFRNLNLGQRRNPTRVQLTDAFAALGATAVLSFRTNGTVVFAARADSRHAVSVNAAARTSYATPALERLLQVPVTSRGAETVLRLGQTVTDEDGAHRGRARP